MQRSRQVPQRKWYQIGLVGKLSLTKVLSVESPTEPSNTCPYNFICRQCYQNTPSPLLMNNLSVSTSLYILPTLLHTQTNFPRYCLHRVVFVTAKFHHHSLPKFRSKTHLCCSMSITTTPSLPCAENFLTKVGGHRCG